MANNHQSISVPVNESVAGKALHQYANMWWQWASSMRDDISAVRDKTGKKCHVNQVGDVWFLAGGYGTSKIQRHCIIPQGKYIFFPIINMAYWPENDISKTCEEVKQESALNKVPYPLVIPLPKPIKLGRLKFVLNTPSKAPHLSPSLVALIDTSSAIEYLLEPPTTWKFF